MRPAYSSLLAILAFSCISGSQAYVSWNQTCDESSSATACDPYQDIACRNSRCECINPSEMEFSSTRGYCVVLAEGHCYKSSGSLFRCVDQASCSYNDAYPERRKCLCNYQRSPDETGHCMKSHGATCEDASECNKLDHLICDFKTCRCPQPMNHVFKEKRNRCFIKVGAPCTLNPAPGSVTCDPEENECLADLLSPTGYSCQCLAGTHMEHFERQCVKSNLELCEDEFGELLHPPCDIIGGLGCHNKRCQCSLSPDMTWNNKIKACTVMEGRGCNLAQQDSSAWWRLQYFFHCYEGLTCTPWEGHKYEGICRKTKTTDVEG